MKSITLKIYERLLTEAKKNGNAEKREPTKKKLNNPEKEAPDDAILGNYAFANVRPGLPPEVNTEVEDDLEQELTTHFINNIHMSAKSGRALKTSSYYFLSYHENKKICTSNKKKGKRI
jgi:hypothetical protein